MSKTVRGQITITDISDGEQYFIELSQENVVIPSNSTYGQLANCTATFWKKTGSGAKTAVSMYCWVYARKGVSLTLISAASNLSQANSSHTFSVNSDYLTTSYDAIVVYIYPTQGGFNPNSQYYAKKEIAITKNGDKGNKGDDGVAYALTCSPAAVNFRRNAAGEFATAYINVYCEVKKSLGGTISDVTPGSGSGVYLFYRKLTTGSAQAWTQRTSASTSQSVSYAEASAATYAVTGLEYALTSNNSAPNNANVLARTTVPVMLDGMNGAPGSTGKAFYSAGQWNSQTKYTANEYECPLVWIDAGSGGREWYYLPEGESTNQDPGQAGTSGNPWKRAQNNWNVILTEALFADFASFQSAVITGDWLISKHGFCEGMAVNDDNATYLDGGVAKPYYLKFDPTDPKGETTANFKPNFALDLKTGTLYGSKMDISGTIHAENFFHRICFFDGVNYSNPIYRRTSEIVDYGERFTEGEYYTQQEIESISDNQLHGGIGFVMSTGPSDIVVSFFTEDNEDNEPSYRNHVNLPDPDKYEGKVVRLFSYGIGSYSGDYEIWTDDGSSKIAGAANHIYADGTIGVPYANSRFPIPIGGSVEFVSAKLYGEDKHVWLLLENRSGGDIHIDGGGVIPSSGVSSVAGLTGAVSDTSLVNAIHDALTSAGFKTTDNNNTYRLTLNGTQKGTTGGTDLGSFYAPMAIGSDGQFLKSSGNGAPSWSALPTASTSQAGIVQLGTGAAQAAKGDHSHNQYALTSALDAYQPLISDLASYVKVRSLSDGDGNNAPFNDILKNQTGSFLFTGENLIDGHYDWVGIQVASDYDLGQLVWSDGTLVVRQNDKTRTESTFANGWSAWATVLTNRNFASYLNSQYLLANGMYTENNGISDFFVNFPKNDQGDLEMDVNLQGGASYNFDADVFVNNKMVATVNDKKIDARNQTVDYIKIASVRITGKSLSIGGFTAIMGSREVTERNSFILNLSIRRNAWSGNEPGTAAYDFTILPTGTVKPRGAWVTRTSTTENNVAVEYFNVYIGKASGLLAPYYMLHPFYVDGDVTFYSEGVSDIGTIAATADFGGIASIATDASSLGGQPASYYASAASLDNFLPLSSLYDYLAGGSSYTPNHLGWTSSSANKLKALTPNALAYWDGRYNEGNSNLEYFKGGKFTDVFLGMGNITMANDDGGIVIRRTSDNAFIAGVTPQYAFTSGTASKLGSATVGGAAKGIYLNGGSPAEMTHSLNATVANGTDDRLAFFTTSSNVKTVTGTANMSLINNVGVKRSGSDTVIAYRNGLRIWGTCYGNSAGNLLSGTAGQLGYGDGGPQIVFSSSATDTAGSSQEAVMLFTIHDNPSNQLWNSGYTFNFFGNPSDGDDKHTVGIVADNLVARSRLYLASGVYIEYDAASSAMKVSSTEQVVNLNASKLQGKEPSYFQKKLSFVDTKNGNGTIDGNSDSVGAICFPFTTSVDGRITLDLSGVGAVTKVKVGDTEYTPSSGVISLPAYPTRASWNYDDVYLKLSGGTLSGNLNLKYTSIDASKAGNNITSTVWPSTMSVLDTSNRIITCFESIVNPSNSNDSTLNGEIGFNIYARQYDTSGTMKAQKGIKYMLSKPDTNGTVTGTWTVSDPASFRNAIGIIHILNSKDNDNEPSMSYLHLPLTGSSGHYSLDLSGVVLTGYLPLTGGTICGTNMQNLAIDSTYTGSDNTALQFRHTKNENGTSTSIMYGGIAMGAQNGSLMRYTSAFAYYDVLDMGNFANLVEGGSNITVTKANNKITIANTYSYSLPTATSSVLGGVKVGDTLAISGGVLNQKSGIATAGTYTKVTVDTYGRVTAGTTLAGSDIPSISATKIAFDKLDAARLPDLSGTYVTLSTAQTISGTKTFSQDVTVSKSSNNATFKLVGGTYTIGLHIGSGGTNRGIYDFTTGVNKWLLYFDANNTILNNGNIGIGTTSPEKKLHVAGDALIAGITNIKSQLNVLDASGNTTISMFGASGQIHATNVYIGGTATDNLAATHRWVTDQGYQTNAIEKIVVPGSEATTELTGKTVTLPLAGTTKAGVVMIGDGLKDSESHLCIDTTWLANNYTPSKLSSNAGSQTQPIYFAGGIPVATTYGLSATVNASTAGYMTYYSGSHAISGSSYVRLLSETNSKSKAEGGLEIAATGYGNAADLISGTDGIISYGDGGPQIRFTPASAQHVALIATHYDVAGAGASLHLVSDQSRVAFVTQEIVGKTRLSVGENTPNTSYNLYVNGTTNLKGAVSVSAAEAGRASLTVDGTGTFNNAVVVGSTSSAGSLTVNGAVTLGRSGQPDSIVINGYDVLFNARSVNINDGSGSKRLLTTADLTNYLPKAGGDLTGMLTINGGMEKFYNLQVKNGADTASYWRKLGTFNLPSSSFNLIIDIFSGDGYNGRANQNSWARIIIKSGWMQTPQIGTDGSNYNVGITCERFCYTAQKIQVRVNVTARDANNSTVGDVYVLLPWNYANGNYAVRGGYTSWTHNTASTSEDTTTLPPHNQGDVGYIDYISVSNGSATISSSSTKEANTPACLVLQTTQTDANTTYGAYIRAYDDGDANGYGTNMVLFSGGNMIVGAGESSQNLYNSYIKGSTRGSSTETAENLYLTADGSLYFDANCNTIANRVGMTLTSGHALVPTKANALQNNLGTLGTSSYRWSGLYVNTVNASGSANVSGNLYVGGIEATYGISVGGVSVSLEGHTHSGYATTDSLGDYLPLSGGTLSGNLYIGSEANVNRVVKYSEISNHLTYYDTILYAVNAETATTAAALKATTINYWSGQDSVDYRLIGQKLLYKTNGKQRGWMTLSIGSRHNGAQIVSIIYGCEQESANFNLANAFCEIEQHGTLENSSADDVLYCHVLADSSNNLQFSFFWRHRDNSPVDIRVIASGGNAVFTPQAYSGTSQNFTESQLDSLVSSYGKLFAKGQRRTGVMTSYLKSTKSGLGTSGYWGKIWDIVLPKNTTAMCKEMTFMVSDPNTGYCGICILRLKHSYNTTTNKYSFPSVILEQVYGNVPMAQFRVYYSLVNGTVELWCNLTSYTKYFNFTVVKQTADGGGDDAGVFGFWYPTDIQSAQTLPTVVSGSLLMVEMSRKSVDVAASSLTIAGSIKAQFSAGTLSFSRVNPNDAAPVYSFDGQVTSGSDSRMKNIDKYLEPSVYDIAFAPLVAFRWKNGDSRQNVGTIAQYWEKILPQAVHENSDGFLSLEYSTIALAAGVTASRKAVDNERRIIDLERELTALRARVAELEQQEAS